MGHLGWVALAACVAAAAALQFDLEASRTKCILEIMSKHDVAKGSFKVQGVTAPTPSGVEVKILGPKGEVEYSKSDAVDGKFAFNANEGGEHRVCFTNARDALRRVAFEFTAGADANDYSDIAKKEHLKPLELELRKLEDKVEGIHKEMLYARSREEDHRNVNESTNVRVVAFSVGSIVIVAVIALVQIVFWHRYFKRKKFL